MEANISLSLSGSHSHSRSLGVGGATVDSLSGFIQWFTVSNSHWFWCSHYPHSPSRWLFGLWALAHCESLSFNLWVETRGGIVGQRGRLASRAEVAGPGPRGTQTFSPTCPGQAVPCEFSTSDWQLFAFLFGVVLKWVGKLSSSLHLIFASPFILYSFGAVLSTIV